MKKLLVFFSIFLVALCANAGTLLPFIAGAAQGNNLHSCMNTCAKGDGQCYQGCAAAYGGNQGMQPQYQQPKTVQYDYSCISKCTNAGYAYGLCQKNCSY